MYVNQDVKNKIFSYSQILFPMSKTPIVVLESTPMTFNYIFNYHLNIRFAEYNINNFPLFSFLFPFSLFPYYSSPFSLLSFLTNYQERSLRSLKLSIITFHHSFIPFITLSNYSSNIPYYINPYHSFPLLIKYSLFYKSLSLFPTTHTIFASLIKIVTFY